ncbi:hypothetical protein OG400_10080 [Micromonospora ureilytica]|uniref:hypothetical protein n=1 Tax=Micromonospora ureilytica TaxID=709868 RepID=UPI002E12CF76|nr:hypothetical protein OG400_10080 [Micromonospora ureilytica]
MTTPSGGSTPDDYWRRPDTGDDAVADQPPAAPAATPPTGPTSQPPTGPSNPPPSEHAGPASTGSTSGYSGPPPSLPPPAGWRPPVHLQPAPPRQLPPQDMADLDAVEQRSQRVTYGFGAAAGVVLLVLLCLLCSRVIF